MRRFCLLLVAITFVLGACTTDPDDENNDNNTDTDSADTELDLDTTTEDGESCENLVCDAIFVPPVTINVKNADGSDYCNDGISVRSWEEGSTPPTGWGMCECAESGRDAGAPTNQEGLVRDDYQCYVNAEPGETTVVEIQAPGYEPMQQTVSLPCRCHPEESVTFELPD
jgi:hypothetical protein